MLASSPVGGEPPIHSLQSGPVRTGLDQRLHSDMGSESERRRSPDVGPEPAEQNRVNRSGSASTDPGLTPTGVDETFGPDEQEEDEEDEEEDEV